MHARFYGCVDYGAQVGASDVALPTPRGRRSCERSLTAQELTPDFSEG